MCNTVGLTKRRCSISLLSSSASSPTVRSRSASKKFLLEASFGSFRNDFSAVLIWMNPRKTLNNLSVQNFILSLLPCRSRNPRSGKNATARDGRKASRYDEAPTQGTEAQELHRKGRDAHPAQSRAGQAKEDAGDGKEQRSGLIAFRASPPGSRPSQVPSLRDRFRAAAAADARLIGLSNSPGRPG